jgi:hypothetical protein
MIHKMVAMARCYPAAVTRILVAARSVAVATRIVTVQARPNAERGGWGRFLREPAPRRGESPRRPHLVGRHLRRLHGRVAADGRDGRQAGRVLETELGILRF